MKRIFITGATGLVGSHLLIELLKKDFSILALYRSNRSLEKVKDLFKLYDLPELFEQIDWVKGDILETDLLDEVLSEVDYIVHAAAKISFSPKDKEKMYRVNVKGTELLVNLALKHGIEYFLHVSSVAALGGNEKIKSEKSIWSWNIPHSDYGGSKFSAEMEVWRGFQEGLKGGIVNPSIIIGPGFWRNSFGLVVDKVYRKKMYFYTEGVNGYVDVRDVINIMLRLLEENIHGERFVLNAGHASFKEITYRLAEFLKVEPPKWKLTPSVMYPARYLINLYGYLSGKGKLVDKKSVSSLFEDMYYDNQKVLNTFGYQFIPIEKSLENIARMYLKKFRN